MDIKSTLAEKIEKEFEKWRDRHDEDDLDCCNCLGKDGFINGTTYGIQLGRSQAIEEIREWVKKNACDKCKVKDGCTYGSMINSCLDYQLLDYLDTLSKEVK